MKEEDISPRESITQIPSGYNDWYVIEGNIGSGKSTLCKMLEIFFGDENAEVIYEPVDEWKNVKNDKDDKNLLQCYYEEQDRWGFSFQLYGLLTRFHDTMKKQEKEMRFVERSIFSYKNVFARFLYENGKMNSMEWNMYEQWFDWLSKDSFKVENKPNGFIYLRANPTTSYNRMLKRERSEEKCVPIEYLESVNKYHEEWLKDEKNVLIIDVDCDFENTPEEWTRIRGLIMNFVEKNKKKNMISEVSEEKR